MSTTCPPDAPDEKKLTTDGLPLPGMEIRVEDGELQVRGPQLARGYWGGREPGRFRADGWFATGDEATVDADGYVRIGGRLDDRIVRGGVNVSPLEIEEVLGTHPHVREVAVSGTPDERLGERIGALVVAEGPAPDARRPSPPLPGVRVSRRSSGRSSLPPQPSFRVRPAASSCGPSCRDSSPLDDRDPGRDRRPRAHRRARCRRLCASSRALGAATTAAATPVADVVLADRHSDLSDGVAAALVCTFETHRVGGGLVASETTAQAAIGLTDYVGPADGPAARLGCDVGTVVAGFSAVQAILAWLHGGRANGTRHDVAVSPLRALSTLKTILWAARTRPDEWVGTHVRSRDRLVDSGYRTRDGRITLDFPVGAEQSWTAFVVELGLDAPTTARLAERWHESVGWGDDVDLARPLYEERLAELTTDDAVELVRRNGGSSVPFQTLAECLDHPQSRALGLECRR